MDNIKKTCRTCVHRQRWECGGRVIQYCRVRRNGRTFNGLLKIKVTTQACNLYKAIENDKRKDNT
jgi:hypothetical protein